MIKKTRIKCMNCGAMIAILYETGQGNFYESIKSGHCVAFDHGFVRCSDCLQKTYCERVESLDLIEKLMEE
jgi:hypothetical protein